MQPSDIPPKLRPAFNEAVRSFSVGDDRTVIILLEGVIKCIPHHPRVLRFLAAAHQRHGDYHVAARYYRDLTRTCGSDPLPYIGYGICLANDDCVEGAVAAFQHACRVAPRSIDALYNLGELLAQLGRVDEARAVLEKGVSVAPSHWRTTLSLANVHASLGYVDKAISSLREIVRTHPDCASAWLALSYLRPESLSADDERILRFELQRYKISDLNMEKLEFALAKAIEARHAYAEAFDMFERANARRARHTQWDAEAASQRTNDAIKAFSTERNVAAQSSFGHEAIFIVSMPRSGSTLVEQILASHPDVAGAGEIGALVEVLKSETKRRESSFPLWVKHASTGDWQRLGAMYLDKTQRWRGQHERFTDKNLLNWELVGAIVSMLPGARIIEVRRDPVETCLACYRQCLGGIQGFASSLSDTAARYADFIHATDAWAHQFPTNVKIIHYESLISQTETTIRSLLEFCGLPFTERCLYFYNTRRPVSSAPSVAQVTRPINQCTARSGKYGSKLDQLRKYLRKRGIPVSVTATPGDGE